MAAPLELRVDAKSAFTLDRFSGAEDRWPNWSVRAEGHFGMLGWTAFMEAAAASPEPFTYGDMVPQAQA
eukprot:881267-Lingulodinium_polyedra.AAC.1